MKILHYIPEISEKKKSISQEYVEAVVRATSKVAESYIVTEKQLGDSFLSFRNAFAKKLKEIQPDIVHFHACWNFRAAYAHRMSRRRHFFTIVSPHGGLSDEIINLDFWKEKLPRIIAYQFWMLRKSRLVISISDKEHQELTQLGWRRRMMLIHHPSFHTISDDDLCEGIMQAYRKVIDTHYTERITKEEKDFVCQCLRAACWKENEYLPDFQPATVSPDLSFRRIYLYAHDNGVTTLLSTGAKLSGINLPPLLKVDELPRFKAKKKKMGNYEKDCKKLCSIIHTIIPQMQKDVIFTPHGEVSLATLTDIYNALRFNDYNEDFLAENIKKEGLSKFTKKLMKTYERIFQLQEGFRPI